MRLSPSQKWDLAGQALAAVLTSALIAVPLVLAVPGSLPRVDRLAAVSGAPALLPPLPAGALERTVATRTSARRAPSQRAIKAAAVTATLTASAERGIDNAPAQSAGVEHKTLGRRIATLFTGDGSVTVRPFPTIPTER